MASDRFQRRIDRFLDQIEAAADQRDWDRVAQLSEDVLSVDPDNTDALRYFEAAKRNIGSAPEPQADRSVEPTQRPKLTIRSDHPTSFVNGRYQVKRFLGEGSKKKVYLAQDTTLDREVAFALIKSEGLDETSRARLQREAQSMGRLGSNAHIVTVFDLGEEQDQPYMVTELMGGGDVED